MACILFFFIHVLVFVSWRKNVLQGFKCFLELLSEYERMKQMICSDLGRRTLEQTSWWGSRAWWIVKGRIKTRCQGWVSTLQTFSWWFQIYSVLKWCSCLWHFLDRCFCPPESYGSDPETHVALVWVTQWHSDTAFSSGSSRLSLQCSCLSSSLSVL